MRTVYYRSLQHKQRAYTRETLPAVFAAARAAMPVVRNLNLGGNLADVHAYLRRSPYVPEFGPKDEIRSVARTLEMGGDCEDYAALQLAVAHSRGVPARIVTAGDGRDNFEHVYVEWKDNGEWTASDPKGDQLGRPYGVHAEWPIKRRWTIRRGKLVEVDARRGSGASYGGALRGSGAKYDASVFGDPVLRTLDDARSYLTKYQIDIWALADSQWKHWRNPRRALRDHLSAGQGTRRLSEAVAMIQQRVGKAIDLFAQNSGAVSGGHVDPHDPTLQTPKTLEEANTYMASVWAQDLMDAGPAGKQALRNFAIRWGGKPQASTKKLAAVAVAAAARVATANGVVFNNQLEAQRRYPDATPAQVLQVAKQMPLMESRELAGSGSVFSEFLNDVGEWFGSVVSEIGKGLQFVANAILDADDDAPWLADFFLRPLGFMLQAEIIQEFGEALESGDFKDFDTEEIGLETAATMTSAGQVLVVASPFIPQPWGVAAAAVGALMVAGGGFMARAIHREAGTAQENLDRQARQQEQQLQKVADRKTALWDAAAKFINSRPRGQLDANGRGWNAGWVNINAARYWAIYLIGPQNVLPVWFRDFGKDKWVWSGLLK